jgi:uncharacterized membrane protein YfcA
MSIEWILLYLLLGCLVGFVAGLLGAGGGGILVPLLTSMFSYQSLPKDNIVHMALGTALACMIISSSSSIYAHASRGTVIWKVFFGMAPGIILGAFLISHIAADINSIYIAIFFAVFMALVAVQMFLNWKPKVSEKPTTFFGLFIAGTGIGSVSALAAVGGGFLSVTYLHFKNIDMKKAIGTSAAIAFPIAIAGSIGYMISGWSKTSHEPYTLGFVYLPAFCAISIASFFTAPIGAKCSALLPDAYLKKIFAVISLLLSIKMLVSVVYM